MNTANLKKYAPQARREFISAVSKQLNQLGIYSDKQISDVKEQGSVLSIEGKTFPIDIKTARERLVRKIKTLGYAQLIEQVAYTWFNRLCAIRYMEIHDYLGHGFRVLSHPDNPKGFEIIDHAQDAADELGLDRAGIIELKLAGNKDEELYRELLLGQCHKLHEAMPFLFDALDDETELLLPDNLTRTDSILRGLVDSIPEEDWQQVEVIGWLYQFYISEKKDQVMGKVVKSEDIPAATQLFTPNWIVKYLVQNSVGRQWLQTYPDSAIKTLMEYYIEPAEQSDEVNQQLKAITPLSSNGEGIEPETIKVLDPACGSGHILIEAYNVLKAIYEERGFRSRDIPKMILENNLYGLDIDDRAAQLSGFALMMMARDDDKRIFTRNVRLNVLSLQESNHIDLPIVWKALNLSGSWQSGTSQGLFSDEEHDLSSFNADNRYQLLKRTLARFTQAKTFGSLIDVPSDEHEQLKELLSTLVELQESGDSMQKPAAKELIEFVHQALVLSIRYEAVIANPPYMGSKGMNADLKEFAKKHYPNSKSDLFAMFMERTLSLTVKHGLMAMINMQSWMFLSAYENLRSYLIAKSSFLSMAHFGERAFDTIGGAVVSTTAFVMENVVNRLKEAVYVRLVDGENESSKSAMLKKAASNPQSELRFSATTDDFAKIPGNLIAYWLTHRFALNFEKLPRLGEIFTTREGLTTGSNDTFLRQWFEVSLSCSVFPEDTKRSARWFAYLKGGEYRRWSGNNEHLVDWENEGERVMSFIDPKTRRIRSHNYNGEWAFKPGITWSSVSGERFSVRNVSGGYMFDTTGSMGFLDLDSDRLGVVAYLNSIVAAAYMKVLSPAIRFQPGHALNLPFDKQPISKAYDIAAQCISLSQSDWDAYETSWDFTAPPLLNPDYRQPTLKATYQILRAHWREMTLDMQWLEEENNRIFIEAYGLQDELDEKVDLNEITLTSNPHYRYGNDKSEGELEALLLADTICELVAYSIGCMMGRYSLDREGLVYAHEGNDGFDKLVAESAYKTYPSDEDGIIPLTDQEWFKDDATNRFREFVQVVWGDDHLQENLDFVAESLCLNAIKPKKSESALETIRRYLSTQFYKDHLKTYKKRPIYWLFSSGKQKAFECLVYLHRYNEGTLSRMRTEYVTPLLGKYDAYAEQLEKQIETADSTSEANRFKKELDALIKKQVELREFDDKLKHYADMRISLDLDDGVKV
ncbi:MAG: BREX-1 system adenine-specific DNA-methyltransferase PglX, partial [Pseudomonadales bacterium]|nr:BREX-1 system adenine-specific DNA-methyltransferase PglX [Pseudomonadales bacterium]